MNIENIHEFNKISRDTVYFGKSACPNCKAFHILLDELLTEQYIKVYYFDTDYFRQTLDNYEELENILLEYTIDQVPSLLNKYTFTNKIFS